VYFVVVILFPFLLESFPVSSSFDRVRWTDDFGLFTDSLPLNQLIIDCCVSTGDSPLKGVESRGKMGGSPLGARMETRMKDNVHVHVLMLSIQCAFR
jgi:hypothetical protein